MSLFRPQTQEVRAEGKPNALFDRALFDRTLEIVDEEVGDLAEQGHASIEARWDEEGEGDAWAGGDVRLIPSAAGACEIWMSIWDDTVNLSTGGAGACGEIWTTVDDEWETTLRERIRCVRDGRYSEVVKGGLIFPVKVRMRFGGIPGRKGRDLELRYGSVLASNEQMPPTGEFTYEPW